MRIPDGLSTALARLSATVDDDGEDLQAILELLLDDLVGAVPSISGLTVEVAVGQGVTGFSLGELDPAGRGAMRLTLPELAGDLPGVTLTLYAPGAGAFSALAQFARAHGGSFVGQVLTDDEVPPHSGGVLPAMDERTPIDQAVGLLIADGLLPELALSELDRRAADRGRTVHQVALDLLQNRSGRDGG